MSPAPKSQVYKTALSALRVARGWSQFDLARRADVAYRSIQGYESGRIRSPRMANLNRIAHAFGLTVYDVFPEVFPVARRRPEEPEPAKGGA